MIGTAKANLRPKHERRTIIQTWSADITIHSTNITANIKYDWNGHTEQNKQIHCIAFHNDTCIMTCDKYTHSVINDWTSVRDMRRGLKAKKTDADLSTIAVGTDIVYITRQGMQSCMQHTYDTLKCLTLQTNSRGRVPHWPHLLAACGLAPTKSSHGSEGLNNSEISYQDKPETLPRKRKKRKKGRGKEKAKDQNDSQSLHSEEPTPVKEKLQTKTVKLSTWRLGQLNIADIRHRKEVERTIPDHGG